MGTYMSDLFYEPTETNFYPDGKTVRSMEWRKGGLLHRENGKPALIEFWKNGKVRGKQFFEYGECYREGDLPTSVFYYETGAVRHEIWENALGWYDRGGDLPAVITYDRCGDVVRKAWFRKDVNFREGSAPEVEIYENGKLVGFVKSDRVFEMFNS